MKRGSAKPLGFTIVEVMIFLAVSSALLVSALTLVSGAQNKTEFSQAVNDVNQQINDTVNNVATGYYANINNFASQHPCSVNSVTGAYVFDSSGTTSTQGGNKDCIFLGRVIQFTDSDTYYVYNVVARRELNNQPVKRIAEAQPRIISAKLNSSFPESTEIKKLKNGLKVSKLTDASGDIAGVAFLSGLGEQDANGLKSGAQSTDYVVVAGNATTNQQDFITNFQTKADDGTLDAAKNPTAGVTMCLKSGGTNQSALLIIGGSGKQDTTTMSIHNGGTCS